MAPDATSLLRRFLGRRHHVLKVQRIRPRRPDQPSLAALNDDLLSLIAHWMYEIDPESLNGLALVCSALYSHARRVQYRDICIDLAAFRHEDNLADSKRLESLARNGFLSAVRTLRIRVSDKTERAIHEGLSPSTKTLHHYDKARLRVEFPVWNRLGELIPQMTGLRDLHWHGHVLPDAVRKHLHSHSDLGLHLSLFATTNRYWPPQQARLENCAAHFGGASASLTALRIKIEYGEALSLRPITRALKGVLLNSPRLRILSIDIGHTRKGGMGRGAEPEYCGFGFVGGEAPAPLEELEIVSYPWGETATWFNRQGYPNPEEGTEMQYWARYFNWSRLRRLTLYYASMPLAGLLAPSLVALEEVYIEYISGMAFMDHSLVELFRTLAPSARLRAVSLPLLSSTENSDVVDALISRHASTLRMLSVTRAPLEASVLSRVVDKLPCLEEITIRCQRQPRASSSQELASPRPTSSVADANITTAWPSHVLTTLSSFTSLSSLRAFTVYFPCGEPNELQMPVLNYSSARNLAEALYSISAAAQGNNTAFPRELRFYSGHLEDFIPDHPSQSEWSRDNATGFVCRRRMAVGKGEGPFEIGCVRLDAAQNGRLREVVEAAAAMTEEEERCVEFLVACRGAMIEATYLAWRKRMEDSGRR
ncbi:hypothetical protein VTJ83DRAFT_1427 [Remersonia thermophila]|uniref:F-box domain-containing protein n=1 Tax=Remersonia thermophila TaxID=72144 RepID=A0ABR4DP02_9PEZI